MSEIFNPVIADLKERARELGSQKALAEELDISESFLSDILAGKKTLSDDRLEELGYSRLIIHVRADQVPETLRMIETVYASGRGLDRLKKKVLKK